MTRWHGAQAPVSLEDYRLRTTQHPETGCWEYAGKFKDKDGYALVWYPGSHGKRLVRLHRLVWELTHEAIPPTVHVCHTCDNPPCINPEHLFTGTSRDNNDDKVRKGRHARGETAGRSKLTDMQVREMRALYAAGGESTNTLARRFGITQATTWKIVRRLAWRHVE